MNSTDEFGRTALHHAAAGGVEAAVELLLARNARVDAADVYGTTPLMLACGAEPAGSCARLLKAGASVAAADSSGKTAMDYAVRAGRSQQSNDLRAAGAAPVHAPQVAGSAGPVDRLPRATADAYSGWPDVVVAASRRDPARLRDLLSRGGDPNSSTPGGESALAVAIASDSADAVSLLLASGADASRADQRGVTPLGLAVQLGHESVVEALLKRGANPNVHGAGHPPPLVVAIERNDVRIATGAAGGRCGCWSQARARQDSIDDRRSA